MITEKELLNTLTKHTYKVRSKSVKIDDEFVTELINLGLDRDKFHISTFPFGDPWLRYDNLEFLEFGFILPLARSAGLLNYFGLKNDK